MLTEPSPQKIYPSQDRFTYLNLLKAEAVKMNVFWGNPVAKGHTFTIYPNNANKNLLPKTPDNTVIFGFLLQYITLKHRNNKIKFISKYSAKI